MKSLTLKKNNLKSVNFHYIITFLSLLLYCTSYTQVGINTDNPNANLDIRSSNQTTPAFNDGVLIPKVDSFSIINPTISQEGMMVFVTGNSTPEKGFYYWDNGTTSWILITDTINNTLNQAYNQGGLGLGKNINAINGAVRINGEDGLLVTGLFGNGDTIVTEVISNETRMFFNPNKAAFRAGKVSGVHWDNANIGTYSTAFGVNTIASGSASTALGYLTVASEVASTSFGSNTEASGQYSTAFGLHSTASGWTSTAFGTNSLASGASAFSFGYFTVASGNSAVAFGNVSIASGLHSTAFGRNTIASGISSTAFGYNAEATGDKATVFGHYTVASGNTSTAFGYQTNAIGNTSTAFGYNTTATGDRSTAFGFSTISSGENSTAFGYNSVASGLFSTAFGTNADASGYTSTSFGQSTTASSHTSTAFGLLSEASGITSMAFGSQTEASGVSSTAFGNNSEASGSYSTAFGRFTTASAVNSTAFGSQTYASNISATSFGHNSSASGFASTSFGVGTISLSSSETAIGSYNTSYLPVSNSVFNSADKLFIIGNGTSNSLRSNALTIYKSGLMNINDSYDMPLTDGTSNQVMVTNGAGVVSFQDANVLNGNTLDQAYDQGGIGLGKNIDATDGAVHINGEDGFLVTGTVGTGNTIDIEVMGAGTRMFFNPNKAAFRAGNVSGNHWDDINIGPYSTALGLTTTASGLGSTALGSNTTASGWNSTTLGYQTNATSFAETAIGFFNTIYTPINPSGPVAADKLFVIGNGTSNNARSNALTIYKSGLMNINDAYNMPFTDGTANQVMVTNGLGVVSFQDANTLNGNTLDQAYDQGGFGGGRIINATNGPVEIHNNGGLIVESTNQTHMLFVDGTNDAIGIKTSAPTADLSVNGTANKLGSGTWAVFSDARLKENVSNYKEGLELIINIRPVNFSYNSKLNALLGKNSSIDGRIYQGVIAQELQKIAPDMVREVVVNKYNSLSNTDSVGTTLKSESFLEVDPNKFTYALINAVQEQQIIIKKLQDEIELIKKYLKSLEGL